MTAAREYPHDTDAERALLGAILTDGRCLATAAAMGVDGDAFYNRDHGRLFARLVELDNPAKPPGRVKIDDMTLLVGALEAESKWDRYGGFQYVFALPDYCVSTANVKHYAERVLEHAQLRRLLEATEGVREAAFAKAPDPGQLAADLMAAAQASQPVRSRGWRSMSSILPEALKHAETAHDEPARHGGLSTGFGGIDEKTGGFHAADLVILAGRPGKGKTALALNVCENAATAGHNIGIFSLEMTAEQLATRTLSGLSGASARDLRSGQVDFHFLFKLRQFLDEHPKHLESLYIDDRPATASQIAARARQLEQEVGDLAVVVVDYLQIIKAEPHLQRAPREVQVSAMSGILKQLAKDLGCTVIALAQLNRELEKRADPTPKASDLRESGAVEQDADIILLIGPDSTVIVAKCRNGETGPVQLGFDGRTTTWTNDHGRTEAEASWGRAAPWGTGT
jgi:replicative DNA helicase